MIVKDSFESYHNFQWKTKSCIGSTGIDMYRKEKRSKNHDSPKTHSKINRIVLDRGRKYAYYAEQMETSFGRKNPVKKRNVERLAEEKKKRSEIMEISDTMARHKAIAENMALFGR